MTTIKVQALGEGSVAEITDMADQFLNGQYELTEGGEEEVEIETWDEPDEIEAFTDSLTQLGYMVEVSNA